ncbi:MAG TPA: MlaD family protein, partial [Nocardioides sp.]|nr:MlaD family protein [Nocardioides sp.]
MKQRRTFASKPARLGVVMLVVTLLVAVGLFSKDKINTLLLSGRTITVHFDQAYKLRPDVSKVKVAYVVVGKVSGVERDPAGGAAVSLKVDRTVLDRLGSQPTAAIR